MRISAAVRGFGSKAMTNAGRRALYTSRTSFFRAGLALRGSGIISLPVILLLLLGGCRAEQPWPLWEAYTRRFLDGQGRIIDRSANGSQQDRTTSEGQAYGLFFALVDNDKAHFDAMLNWTEANLASGDMTLHLPAWDWGHTATGEWRIIDQNSAADADLWMAYTLMQAGHLWREPRYTKLGEVMASHIARAEVVLIPGLGTTLAPGPTGFHPDPQSYFLNPSYLPLPVLTYMAKALPQGPWSSVLASLPRLLDASMDHGFVMDWLLAGPNGVHPSAPPAEPSAGVREAHPSGSYDAIRTYLWLGVSDPETPGRRSLLAQVPGMANVLDKAASPPLEIDAQGAIVHADSPAGFSAAVIPYLQASGHKAAAQLQSDRLTASRDLGSGLYGRDAEYYQQNLALFSTAWSEGRFHFERDGTLRVKWK